MFECTRRMTLVLTISGVCDGRRRKITGALAADGCSGQSAEPLMTPGRPVSRSRHGWGRSGV